MSYDDRFENTSGLPDIWEAVGEVDIVKYAINEIGYTVHKNGSINRDTVELELGDKKIGAGGYNKTGRYAYTVYRGGGESYGNIISMMKNDLNLSGRDLAEEVKRILNKEGISYFDPSSNSDNDQARSLNLSQEQLDRLQQQREDRDRKQKEKAEIKAKENQEIFRKTKYAIEQKSIPFKPNSKGGEKLREIPVEIFQMMGKNTPDYLKAQPEYKHIKNTCLYTERRGQDGTKYENLNFLLRDLRLNIIGIGKKHADTGKDAGLVKGGERGWWIAGNLSSRNIVFTENPLDALSFNIAKERNFANTLHFSSLGKLSEKRMDEVARIFQKRIKEDKPTTLYMAFDNDEEGEGYAKQFKERLTPLIADAQADTMKFKIVDARCDKDYSDYNDLIRGIKKKTGGEEESPPSKKQKNTRRHP